MFKLDTLEDKFSNAMTNVETLLYKNNISKTLTCQLQELENLKSENEKLNQKLNSESSLHHQIQ